MTARQAIREELEAVRSVRKKKEEQIAKLDAQERALNAALKALGSVSPSKAKTNGHASASPKRGRSGSKNRGRLIRMPERKQMVLDHLRANPDQGWFANSIADQHGWPSSSTANAIEELSKEGSVVTVGTGPRGGLIVRHKPTSVHVGEGVRS